jgi:ribosome-binding ATPase
VRAFEDGDVVHVDGKVSPSSDIETIHTELILADLQTLEKALARLEKEARIKKESKPLLENALAAQKVLEEGITLYAAGAAAGVDLGLASGLGLLTTKPFIYVFNLDEEQLADADLHARLGALVAPADAVFLNAKLEMDLMEMSAEDALEMLQSFGAEESGLDQLARVGFHTLGLQTYLTAGPKESRAWTIHRGWTAPQAAGVIHTDFQRGFIKAEIVSFTDLDAAGSMAAARAAGRVRMEGKEYVMQDGDVVEFRFNV